MKYSLFRLWLLVTVFVLILTTSGSTGEPSYYPIISLRMGQIYGHGTSDFFDVYNSAASFPRPIYTTDSQWKDFYPEDPQISWAAEFGIALKRRFVTGISVQFFNHTWKDEFIYTSTIKFPDEALVTIPNIKEQHQFKINSTPVLVFLDFRLFPDSWVRPVVGIGAGINTLSWVWSWKIHGKKVTEDETYLIEGSDVYLNKNHQVIFAFQPRARLEISLSRVDFLKRFVDCIYLQADYLFARYNFDFFRRYREKHLSHILPEELTPAQKKLFTSYDLEMGGLQIMAGFTLRFEVPGEK